jgi:hypothetical protein
MFTFVTNARVDRLEAEVAKLRDFHTFEERRTKLYFEIIMQLERTRWGLTFRVYFLSTLTFLLAFGFVLHLLRRKCGCCPSTTGWGWGRTPSFGTHFHDQDLIATPISCPQTHAEDLIATPTSRPQTPAEDLIVRPTSSTHGHDSLWPTPPADDDEDELTRRHAALKRRPS